MFKIASFLTCLFNLCNSNIGKFGKWILSRRKNNFDDRTERLKCQKLQVHACSTGICEVPISRFHFLCQRRVTRYISRRIYSAKFEATESREKQRDKNINYEAFRLNFASVRLFNLSPSPRIKFLKSQIPLAETSPYLTNERKDAPYRKQEKKRRRTKVEKKRGRSSK